MNQENSKKIKEALRHVIAFFDMFDFPLTAFEIWKFCNQKSDLETVEKGLEDLVKNEKQLTVDRGMYFKNGREQIVEQRIQRYNQADIKFQRAIFVSRIFSLIPWIKFIALGNVIGANNAKKESDIDLFIVSQNGRLWLTRFFCVLITIVLNLRPKINNAQDKICLSFFVSEGFLNFRKIMLGEQDYYFAYWLSNIYPIYDSSNVYQKIINENFWIYDFFPNWFPVIANHKRRVKIFGSFFYRDVCDMLFGGLEKTIKKIQIKIMPPAIREIMNQDTRVIISDQILKMHVNDRRDYYNKKYVNQIF